MSQFSSFITLLKKKYLVFLGAGFGIFFFLSGLFFPDQISDLLKFTNQALLSQFDFYYLYICFFFVLVSLLLLLIPRMNLKLGNGKPEYSTFSWIAMLYSTGMGSGLLLRAVQEPSYYYNNPPISIYDPEVTSLQFTFFHWGLTPWSMYSLFGLIISYRMYVLNIDNIVVSMTHGIKNPFMKMVAITLIVLMTIAGVIASLGLGTSQFIGGLNQYFKLNLNLNYFLFIVFSIGIVSTTSALTGLQRVIKYLANFDVSVSMCILFFLIYHLDISFTISQTGYAIYLYLIHFLEMSLRFGSQQTSIQFTQEWTVFYWAFWLAWVPFTGIFIARISKGRTVNEFIFATIIVPTFSTIVWYSIFANQAFVFLKKGNQTQFDDIYTSIFVFLKHFPFPEFTIFVTAFLILLAIINSVDSAIYVLSMLSDDGNRNPTARQKLTWGAIITISAMGLIVIGSDRLLITVSHLLILLSFPFSLFYLFCVKEFLFTIFFTSKQGIKPTT